MGKRKRAYEIKSEHPISEVFNAMREGHSKFNRASVKELRIQNFFEHGVKCVECGRVGTIFRVERARKAHNHKYARWHLNLYCRKETGGLVMMTADHITPKSRGGPTTLENLQPMCGPCNARKGNLLPGESLSENKKWNKKRSYQPRRKKQRVGKRVVDYERLLSVKWVQRALVFAVLNAKLPALPRKRIRR